MNEETPKQGTAEPSPEPVREEENPQGDEGGSTQSPPEDPQVQYLQRNIKINNVLISF
jgi:hypothetical protein